jgi:hypothetical protein
MRVRVRKEVFPGLGPSAFALSAFVKTSASAVASDFVKTLSDKSADKPADESCYG